MSNATLLERSYIGDLSDSANCALHVADKFDAMKYPGAVKVMVVVDAHSRCYASARSSTIDKMLMAGELALIGTYTNKCPLSDISDDIFEMSKEYA